MTVTNQGVPAGRGHGCQWITWRETQMDVQEWTLLIWENIYFSDLRLYDEDDSGVIDMEEMTKFSSYLYQIEGASESEAIERSQDLFTELDIDESGEIDREEFIRGCLRALQQDVNSVARIRMEHVEQADKPKETFIGSVSYFTWLEFKTRKWTICDTGEVRVQLCVYKVMSIQLYECVVPGTLCRVMSLLVPDVKVGAGVCR